jgi:hypothetical protein
MRCECEQYPIPIVVFLGGSFVFIPTPHTEKGKCLLFLWNLLATDRTQSFARLAFSLYVSNSDDVGRSPTIKIIII